MRWRYGFYPTTLLETAIVLTVVVFAFETWRGHLTLQWRTAFTIPALLFILAGAISVLVAPSRTAGLGLYRAYIIEPIAFAFVLMHAVTTWRRALVVLSGFGVAGIVVGLANSIVVIAALRAHTYDVTQTPPVVIYTTANALALFLGPLIAVAASLFLHGTSRELRIGSGVVLLLAVPSMLLSFSRGGYLAMAAGTGAACCCWPAWWWPAVWSQPSRRSFIGSRSSFRTWAAPRSSAAPADSSSGRRP